METNNKMTCPFEFGENSKQKKVETESKLNKDKEMTCPFNFVDGREHGKNEKISNCWKKTNGVERKTEYISTENKKNQMDDTKRIIDYSKFSNVSNIETNSNKACNVNSTGWIDVFLENAGINNLSIQRTNNTNANYSKVQRVCEDEKPKKQGRSSYDVMRELIKKQNFVSVGGALYHYCGTHYQKLKEEKAKLLIMDFCRDEIEKSGSPTFVKWILDFLEMEPELSAGIKANQNLIGFKNGVLDVKANKFYEHSPRFFITSILDVDYNPNAIECPWFSNFIYQITGGNDIISSRVWQVIGYYFSVDMKGKIFTLLYGPTNTGKSLFGNFLSSFFTEESIASIDLKSLGERFYTNGLVGKRVNLSMDLPSGIITENAVAVLKMLTGGDRLMAEEKYCNPYYFSNTCKLLFSSNHLLKTKVPDGAFNDRLLILSFLVQIPREQQRHDLLEMFINEKEAVVRHALLAYRRLIHNNYIFDGEEIVQQLIEDSKNGVTSLTREDVVTKFVDQVCRFSDMDCFTTTAELYEKFIHFCRKYNFLFNLVDTEFSRLFGKVAGNRVKKTKRRMNGTPLNGYAGVVVK